MAVLKTLAALDDDELHDRSIVEAWRAIHRAATRALCHVRVEFEAISKPDSEQSQRLDCQACGMPLSARSVFLDGQTACSKLCLTAQLQERCGA